eukprot:6175245-Ditylum_brightwellii.AAC.1
MFTGNNVYNEIHTRFFTNQDELVIVQPMFAFLAHSDCAFQAIVKDEEHFEQKNAFLSGNPTV